MLRALLLLMLTRTQTIWSSGQTDFGTCISATGSLFEAMEEFTVEKQV